MFPVAYSSEQLRIAGRIVKIGRGRGATRKEILSALETGLVESGLRNLNYGDADSKGWRQERQQFYSNPTNVRASINRYFDETAKAGRGKGITAGELAARVQRPREDLRGRYHERKAEAKTLLGHLTRGQPLPKAGGGSTQQSPGGLILSGSDGGQSLGAASTVATDMLKALRREKQQRGSVGLSMPAFAAAAALPQGYQAPVSGGGPAPKQDTAALIDASRTPGEAPVSGGRGDILVGAGQQAAAGRGAGGQVKALKPGGGYAGSKRPATQIANIGKRLGLQVTSTKRNNTNPYSGSRSDHDVGNKDAYAYDMSNGSKPTPEMDEYAYRAARALGIKGYKRGTPIMRTVTRDGYRYQLIYRGTGAAFGGNHLNHVHLGVKRA